MKDGIFKDLVLNVPRHKAWILANLDFVHHARLKISQGVGSRINSTDTVSKRLIRVDSLIYPFHLKKIAVPGSETSLLC